MVKLLAGLLLLAAAPCFGQMTEGGDPSGDVSAKTLIEADPSRFAVGALIAGGSDVLILGGQVGLDADGNLPATLEGQLENIFRNIALVLSEAGMAPTDIASLTYYLVRPEGPINREYSRQIFTVQERILGTLDNVGAAVYISGLYAPDVLVEVQGIAVRRLGN